MKHIVNFSGGDCSFWSAHRVIERFGRENTILLFADVLIEDADLYAFNAKAGELLGIPITRISYGLNPWELFLKEKMIGNNRFPICSVLLKREPLNQWKEQRFEMDRNQGNALFTPATMYIGFDWTEEDRLKHLRAEHPTWRIEAPMQWEPVWDKCRMRREAEALGLPEQKLYKLGFPHNNCGGGCVRAGISHWVHLYHVLPLVFAWWERKERETADALIALGSEQLSMLKDRRGGETKSLYLWQLRARIEAGEKFPKHDWGGCGCGGATKESLQPPLKSP